MAKIDKKEKIILIVAISILIIFWLEILIYGFSQGYLNFSKNSENEKCIENWHTAEWGKCIDGQQIRGVKELNHCGTYENKPAEIQNCSCVEIWNCSPWSECNNGQQERYCPEINNCWTIFEKPEEERECIEEEINTFTECNLDFSCFINAAETCKMASITHTNEVNLLGILITTRTEMEIEGYEKGKCVYYQKTIEQNIEYSEALKQNLKDQGFSNEEITAKELAANEQANSVEGISKTCRFEINYFVIMLNNWKQGSFSSSDLSSEFCS
ncbi:hypothetical protein J4474_04090 [Candidatus Pacearchaeota archaeon]|nr:hypothetical protein [Candidatus Pacearchaeota archaeon]